LVSWKFTAGDVMDVLLECSRCDRVHNSAAIRTQITRATPTMAATTTISTDESEPETSPVVVGAMVGAPTSVGTAVGVAVPVIALAEVALALTVVSVASV
jgi:hypothetical protein